MAEPVSQSEVEDVLSSIRRLVGETGISGHARSEAASSDRLVLTPQLRVAERSAPRTDVLHLTPEDAVDSASRPDDSATEGSSDPLVLSKPVAKRIVARRTDVSELTAKIAALETAIARTVDQWEPDGAGRDAYAGTQPPRMDWPDNVDLDGTGKPVATPDHDPSEAPEPAPTAQEAAVEEQIIDEHMLRAIVAEIVRAELQGELGERITRNVRKLVRREIHRALAAQSLE